MKKTIAAFFAILFLSFAASAQDAVVTAEKKEIVWEKDYKKAVALARETNKPLLLDFTAVWCKPCQTMDKEFWVLPEVIDAVKGFIAVKVDFDGERSLAGKYNVHAIPNVIFADPLGNMIASRTGFSAKKVSDLHRIFDEMPKDFSPLKPFYDALDLKKNDGNALFRIAEAYRGVKMVRLSSEFYKKALKTPEIEGDAEKKDRVMTAIGVNSYTLGDFENAVDQMEDYLKELPSGANKELAMAVLSIANAKRGKTKDANKYLEMLKAMFPASKYIAQATGAIENGKGKKND